MTDLVESLRGIVRVAITDGLGKVDGNLEPDNEHEFVRQFPTSRLQHEAADEIERLRAEVAKLSSPSDHVMAGKPLSKTQIETLANNIHNVNEYAYTVECLTHHLAAPAPAPHVKGSVRARAIEIICKEAEELGYCDDDVAVFRRGDFDGDDLLTLQAVERALAVASEVEG